jgi:fructose-1,6-bisphosphatase/inositol monophosphatase family enzyme
LLRTPVGTGSVTGRRTWVIDPIDGTVNFVRGIGPWSVGICLIENDNTRLSGVHLPATGETFAAPDSSSTASSGSKLGPKLRATGRTPIRRSRDRDVLPGGVADELAACLDNRLSDRPERNERTR